MRKCIMIEGDLNRMCEMKCGYRQMRFYDGGRNVQEGEKELFF